MTNSRGNGHGRSDAPECCRLTGIHRSSRLWRLIALSTISLLLAPTFVACKPSRSSVDIPMAVDDGSGSGTPIAFFTSDSRALAAAIDVEIAILTQRCMADHGFRFDPDLSVSPGAVVDYRRRYGVFDPAHAASNGFLAGAPENPEARTPDDIGFPSEPRASEAYLSALFGESKSFDIALSGGDSQPVELFGGCIAQASQEFFGSEAAWLEFSSLTMSLGHYDVASFMALSSSDEFDHVARKWTQCMYSKGEERFSSPFDTMNYDWPAPRPSDEETRVAMADAECKDQTGFVDAAVGIEARWQQAQPELASLVLAYRELSDDVRSRIVTVRDGYDE